MQLFFILVPDDSTQALAQVAGRPYSPAYLLEQLQVILVEVLLENALIFVNAVFSSV